VTDVTTT